MKRINLDKIVYVLEDYIDNKEHRVLEIIDILSNIAGEAGWEQLSEELSEIFSKGPQEHL